MLSHTQSILYRQEGNPSEQWVECVANVESSTVTLGNLESQTAYHFKVRAVCEVGISLDSEESDPIPTEPSPYNRLAVIIYSRAYRPLSSKAKPTLQSTSCH